MVNITKKTNTNKTTIEKNRTISYIVIHYTASTISKTGSAANIASYFATSDTEASADFIVDDSTIVQYNPDIRNRYTWHCGGKKNSGHGGASFYGKCTNHNSIGIEICSTNSTKTVTSANDSNWSFTDAAVSKAIELTKYLMQTYGIDASHVIRHFDVTGKWCPGIIGWNSDTGSEAKWQAFKKCLTEEDDDMTQDQFNEMMNTYLEQLAAKESSQDWENTAMTWGQNKGLVQGDSSGRLMPKLFMTRAQVMTVLKRYDEAK